MRKVFLLIKICFISLFFLPSCNKKCNQIELANLRFTSDDININPYSGNEKLTFKNLTGDSIFFTQGKREASSFTHYQIDIQDANEYHHGCRGNYYTDETNETNFYAETKDNYPSEIRIIMGFNFSFNDPSLSKYIFLVFYDNLINMSFNGTYLFDNDSLFNYHIKVDSIFAYHNQITVGPRTFSNVYELYAHNGGTYSEYLSIAYYSIKVGFCGFKSNYGKILYLDKKVN